MEKAEKQETRTNAQKRKEQRQRASARNHGLKAQLNFGPPASYGWTDHDSVEEGGNKISLLKDKEQKVGRTQQLFIFLFIYLSISFNNILELSI